MAKLAFLRGPKTDRQERTDSGWGMHHFWVAFGVAAIVLIALPFALIPSRSVGLLPLIVAMFPALAGVWSSLTFNKLKRPRAYKPELRLAWLKYGLACGVILGLVSWLAMSLTKSWAMYSLLTGWGIFSYLGLGLLPVLAYGVILYRITAQKTGPGLIVWMFAVPLGPVFWQAYQIYSDYHS